MNAWLSTAALLIRHNSSDFRQLLRSRLAALKDELRAMKREQTEKQREV
jgi:hypothetical protein